MFTGAKEAVLTGTDWALIAIAIAVGVLYSVSDPDMSVRYRRALLVFGPEAVAFGLWGIVHRHDYCRDCLTVSSGSHPVYLATYQAWGLVIGGALMFVVGLIRVWIEREP